jgi:hypothetical protein
LATFWGWRFPAFFLSDLTVFRLPVLENCTQTLDWLEREVLRLDALLPSVVFTHFPLAAPIRMAFLNAG